MNEKFTAPSADRGLHSPAVSCALALVLVACGGGGGGGGSTVSSSRTQAELSGTVQMNLVSPAPAGLLVLNDGLETLAVNLPAGGGGSIGFSFPSGLNQGTKYAVTVLSNPSGLICTPTNNSGTVGASNVSNVLITCSDQSFVLGGTVTGMQLGGGVQLTDGAETIIVTASTAPGAGGRFPTSYVSTGPTSATWRFPTPVAYGTPYNIQVEGQSAVQCSLANPRGTMPANDVNVLALTCNLPQLSILAGGAAPANGSVNSGAGGAAALFATPLSLAFDAAGNLFVGDGSTVRKITPTGIVSTLAGSPGKTGFTDGTGSLARFSSLVEGIALDGLGNLYVADSGNNAIRIITPAGVVSTFAGSGAAGFTDGKGAAASFKSPSGVAFDAAGNLYVGDSGNYAIRRITPSGDVSTVAGSGTFGSADGVGAAASFGATNFVAIDHSGNLFVADADNQSIRKVTPAGAVTTFAGPVCGYGGCTPVGLAFDTSGNLYVSFSDFAVIDTITPSGVISTFAGSGQNGSANGIGTAASFNGPVGIAFDAGGNLFVAEQNNHAIREITPAGVVSTFAGSVSSSVGFLDGTGTGAAFNMFGANGLAVDSTSNIYVSDDGNAAIRKIAPAGVVSTFAKQAGGFGIAFDGLGNLYFSDDTNNVIWNVTPSGSFSIVAGDPNAYPNTFGVCANSLTDPSTGNATFCSPEGIAVDSAGNLYVSDTFNDVIRKVTPAGAISTFAGTGTEGFVDGTAATASFHDPRGIAIDAAGNLYVSDQSNHAIRKISATGGVSTLAGSGTAGFVDGTGSAASFNGPSGVAVDGAGNVYVADTGNNSIRKVSPTGVVTTIAGGGPTASAQIVPSALPGQFAQPGGLALSPPDVYGNFNLYFTTGNAVAEIVNVNVY